jgi:hypothetical protein
MDEDNSSNKSKVPRRLGFGAVLAVALFAANRGCSTVNASPSWIIATAWFAGTTTFLVVAIWFWEHTTQRHWIVRSTLSLFVVSTMSVITYGPIREQYRREHTVTSGFPKEEQRPHLHIQNFQLFKEKRTNRPGISVFFKTVSPGSYAPIEVEDFYRIVVANFPGDAPEHIFQNTLFNGMMQKLLYGSLGDHPPDSERYVTITGEPISEKVETQIKNGLTAVYFMGRFRYRIRGGQWFHSDYCAYYRGDPPPIFMCREHNDEP